VVASSNGSIAPEVVNAERSMVELTTVYCKEVLAACPGMVAL